MKLGAGEDLYALFAGILTMRPWNRVIDPAVDHLVIQGGDSDRSELQVSFCVWKYIVPAFLTQLCTLTKSNFGAVWWAGLKEGNIQLFVGCLREGGKICES